MTISTVDTSSGPYVGNGIADTFEYDFKIFDKTQLTVLQTDTDGVTTTLAVDSDYTVTNVGEDDGGDIVLSAPLVANYQLFIRANIPVTQETDFESQGGFFPDVHEDAFDKLTLLIQQNAASLARAVRLSEDLPLDGDFVIAEDVDGRRNKVLRFDADGNIELVEFGSIEGLQNFKIQTVAVTAGVTEVTVPFTYLPNTSTIWVTVNGAYVPRSAYSELPGKIVFDNALSAGEVTFFGVSTAPVGTADAANVSYRETSTVEEALGGALQTVDTLAELQAITGTGADDARYLKDVGHFKWSVSGGEWVPANDAPNSQEQYGTYLSTITKMRGGEQFPVGRAMSKSDYDAIREGTNTDDQSVLISNVLDDATNLLLGPGIWYLDDGLAFDNRNIQGAAQDGITTRVIGRAVMGVNTPLISAGRTSTVQLLSLEYDAGAVTGSEAADERLALYTHGALYELQRGSYIGNLRFLNVGTAIGDKGDGCFSVSFGPIEVGAHAYAGVNLYGEQRTGNNWENIYINGGDTYSSPKFGFNFDGQESGGVIGQLNIEHQKYSQAALRLKGLHGTHFATVHLEGIDTTAADLGYVEVDESHVSIESFNALNTRMSYDNTYIFKLLNARYTNVGTASEFDPHSMLKIGTYHVKGLANPNTGLYPSYPSGRRYLSNVSGFEHFHRDSAYTNDDFEVDVDNYTYKQYVEETQDATKLALKYPDTRYTSDRIDLKRFEGRGRLSHPNRNFVSNGAFDEWAGTSVSTTGAAVEAASDWFIETVTGTINASQVVDDYGRDNAFILQFDNVGTSGTFQRAYTDITDFRQLVDSDCVLSFEGKATVAGRRLEQVTATLYTDSGTPASVYKQVLSGTNAELDFSTDWLKYQLKFEGVASVDFSSLGANPYIRIEFQINDASASRESDIQLRNVKLERGNKATGFTR